MHIKSLKLENFRNHIDLQLGFESKGITVFLGKNGIGKTNILEAIYTLALTKSWRSSHIKELINWDQSYFRIRADLEGSHDDKLEFFYQNLPEFKRSLKKSDIPITLKKYLGSMPVSFFSPGELNMIYLEPNRRRKYLNTVLSQIFPEYLEALVKYEKLLTQRNKQLWLIAENRASKDDLEVWNDQIIPYGETIIKYRKKFLEEISKDFEDFYRQISGEEDLLEIEYQGVDNFSETLKNAFGEDLRRKVTTVGPHRDDFEVILNGHVASHFGSRGECRSVVLALKLSERNFFQKHCHKHPIILLDDVFSELDLERQKHLLELLSDSQVFITTSLEEHELPEVEMRKINLNT